MARLNSNAKRDKKIYELRKSNPRVWSYSKIGQRYNLSKQRVYSICEKMERIEKWENGELLPEGETNPELHEELKQEQA